MARRKAHPTAEVSPELGERLDRLGSAVHDLDSAVHDLGMKMHDQGMELSGIRRDWLELLTHVTEFLGMLARPDQAQALPHSIRSATNDLLELMREQMTRRQLTWTDLEEFQGPPQ
jgi:hypothetical protein